jgi:DNA-binding transcriptional regulator of glucitol operon
MSDAAVTLTETETSVLVAHLFSQWLRSETPWTEWAPRLSNDAFAAFSDQAETLAWLLAGRFCILCIDVTFISITIY